MGKHDNNISEDVYFLEDVFCPSDRLVIWDNSVALTTKQQQRKHLYEK